MSLAATRLRAGVIPYTINDKGKVVVLLGKEMFGSWAPFAGTFDEEDQALKVTAAREFHEEIMGFFTQEETLARLNDKRKIVIRDGGIHTELYLMQLDYDELLPKYWQNVLMFLLRCAPERNEWGGPVIPTCPGGYLEKSEIAWFEVDKIDPTDRSLFSNVFRSTMSEIKRYDWFKLF